MFHPLFFNQWWLIGTKLPNQSKISKPRQPAAVACIAGKGNSQALCCFCAWSQIRLERWGGNVMQQRQRIWLHHQEREGKSTKTRKEKENFHLSSLIISTTVQMHETYASKSTECWLQHLSFTYNQPLLCKLVALMYFPINNLFKANTSYSLWVVLHYLFCIALLHEEILIDKTTCWYKTSRNAIS